MKSLSLIAYCLVLLAPLSSAAETKPVEELRFEPTDAERERTVPVKVYLAESDKPQPVVLFSHGLGGSRENNAYLGKYWGAAGYVAVFMQHPGSDEQVWKAAPPGERLAALKAAASAKSFRDRNEDVSFVIDQLESWNDQAGHPLNGKLDLKHIGMSGHSFGAVTTLSVAGRKYPFNRNFAEERITAFLAMSPQPGKGMSPSAAFGQLSQPILCMTGANDGSPIDSKLQPADRRKVYEALPAGDKYQLVLDGAEHYAFGDSDGRLLKRQRNSKHHPAIQKISLQFWNAYLKGDEKSKKWLQSERVLTESGLGEGDAWEWK